VGQFKGIEEEREAFLSEMMRLSGQQSGRFVKEIKSRSKLKDFPTFSKLPQSFWVKARTELNKMIEKHATKVYVASAIANGMPRKDAEAKGKSYGFQRARQASVSMINTSFNRAGTLHQKLEDRIDNSIETSHTELRLLAQPVFSPERGRQAAINETTRAASKGAEDAAAFHGLKSPNDKWKTNPPLTRTGPCPVCRPLNNKTRRVWERTFPDGPPAHIGCVCEIVYANARRLGQRARRNR
jgi:hypothetical protein